jgi:hypothetical protein
MSSAIVDLVAGNFICNQGAGPEINSQGVIQAKGSQSSVNDTIVLLAGLDFPV